MRTVWKQTSFIQTTANILYMTLEAFLQLDFEQRALSLQKAVFIAQRESFNYTALLYQLDSFYIEAIKHKKYQYIYQVDGFDDQERLNPYLERIETL